MRVLKAFLYVNCATLLWAGNVVLGRHLRAEIGPWSLAFLRAGVASLLFALILYRMRSIKGKPIGTKDALLLVGMGLVGVLAFQVLQYAGLRSTTAVNAGIVSATGPVISLFMSRMLLGERFNTVQLVGGLISLVGVALLVSRGSFDVLAELRFNVGDLLVLAAVVCWALYSVLGKIILAKRPTLWVTGVSTIIGFALLLTPGYLELSGAMPAWTTNLLIAILYIGAGPSCLAFIAWNQGVKLIGPNGAMAFINTLPLYTGLIAAFTLGEALGTPQLVGGALIIPGSLMVALSRR